jgi:acetyl esterase
MLDEASRALMTLMAARRPVPFHEGTPQEARAQVAASAVPPGQGPAMKAVTDVDLGSADGSTIRLRILVPSADPRGVMLYLHGGGWVVGDIEGSESLARRLAADMNLVVALADYRLAPEWPFPAAVEDSVAALAWLAAHREDFGSPSLPLLLAGDSAGANLAIVAAGRGLRHGRPQVDLMLLAYPVTDCDVDRPSYLDPANQLVLTRESMQWFLGHYAGGQDARHPDISPLRAADLSGFPSTVMMLAEHDPLRDEGVAFARRLAAVGALVDVRTFEGQMHGFFSLLGVLPASDRAIEYLTGQVDSFFRSALERSSHG